VSLARHPFFEATDPTKSKVVRISAPFPKWLNPFWADGVSIRAAAIPGEIEHSKSYMARELLLGPISEGLITQRTVVKEATSGNTGHGIAKICKALGIRCQLIMPAGTARSKINAISVMGGGVEVVLHSDPDETPVARARREGAQEGCYNLDQYGSWRNPWAHKTYLARQLFADAGEVSLVSVASGTMGTCMGLKQYADENGLPTRILPVLLEENQEVPGARPMSKVQKDVRLPWQKAFTPDDIEVGTRHPSFLLAYYSWRVLPQMLGPSFGLAFQGALRRIHREKLAGRLDALRVQSRIEVIIVGADSYLPYLDLFLGETQSDERHTYGSPDLMALALR
jgi:cysteine synthase